MSKMPVFANYSMMHACDSETQRKAMRDKLWNAIKDAQGVRKTTSGLVCVPDEDEALEKQYASYFKALGHTGVTKSAAGSSPTSLTKHGVTFFEKLSKDSVVQDLAARIALLNPVDYSFLHNKSGAVTNSTNKDAANQESITEDLNDADHMWTQSGVEHLGMVLFGSKQLAQCGRYLAGKQQVECGSPAERGYCADLFVCGTVAPGREKSLWTVHLVCGESGALTKRIWVKANELEKAKYRTMRFMKCRLRDRKLQLIELMRKAAALAGVTAGAGTPSAPCAQRNVESLDHYLEHAATHAIQRLAHKHKAWALDSANDEDRCFSDEDDDSDMYARYAGGSSKLRDACMSNQLRVSMSKSGGGSNSAGKASQQSAHQSKSSRSKGKTSKSSKKSPPKSSGSQTRS